MRLKIISRLEDRQGAGESITLWHDVDTVSLAALCFHRFHPFPCQCQAPQREAVSADLETGLGH